MFLVETQFPSPPHRYNASYWHSHRLHINLIGRNDSNGAPGKINVKEMTIVDAVLDDKDKRYLWCEYSVKYMQSITQGAEGLMVEQSTHNISLGATPETLVRKLEIASLSGVPWGVLKSRVVQSVRGINED